LNVDWITMKNVAYVITDGSHDINLKVGGVAGKLVLHGEDKETNFKFPVFNAFDSTIVEFRAIEESVKLLKRKIKEGSSIDHVVFATDSLDLICLLDPQQIKEKYPKAIPYIEKSKKYHLLAEKMSKITSEINVTFELIKVKAHVPDIEASPLESLHNQVDLMAKEPKDRIISEIKIGNVTKGKAFTVMIPRDMTPEAQEKVKRASLNLIKKGYAPRVLLQSGAENPILHAIHEYEEERGTGAARDVRSRMRTIHAVEDVNEDTVSISSLNRSRARQWIVKEGGHVDEWALNGLEGSLMNDIIKSTIGNMYPISKISRPDFKGRLTEKASEFVLHHGEENLMNDHLIFMNRALTAHGIDRMVVNDMRFSTPQKDVNEELKEMGY
jgi:hypothetical protein